MANLPLQEQTSPKIPGAGMEDKVNLPGDPPHGTKPGNVLEQHEQSPPAPAAFDQTDELYVHNAGIALIAPYLPRLWQQLGWTAKNRFNDPEMAWLAVQMIQFLCDGQEDVPPEYQLALPKILCGFGPDTLFEPPRPLNDDERAEGEALLETVLEHVPGLGLRSAGALRGSFLLRNGVLRSGGSQWLLHVEKETYDLVLQKVPWGFQVLKFPWMEVAVFVEWEG